MAACHQLRTMKMLWQPGCAESQFQAAKDCDGKLSRRLKNNPTASPMRRCV